MKQFRYSLFLAIAAILAACANEPTPQPTMPDTGMVTLRGNASIPAMATVSSRALDGDGLGVKSLQCFCFDESGLMLCRVTAKITADNGAQGEFEAQIPNSVRTIHFIANGNFDFFKDSENIGRHETAVISQLESTSGMMVYWGRVEEPDGFAKYNGGAGRLTVPLIRNQARVSVEGNLNFIVTGFAICNKYAWGTVAPFNRTNQRFDWELPTADNDKGNLYVTLPPDVEKATDDTHTWDIEQNPYRYIFENPNDESDQTYVIVKGHKSGEDIGDDLYYKVLLLDKDKNPYPVYRNHHYKLKINGSVSLPGAATMEEAKEATPLNNVLLAVGPEIYSISDGTQTFSLDQKTTTYLYTLQEGELEIGEKTISYTFQTTDPVTAPVSEPEVSLISNRNAIRGGISHSFTVSDDGLTGRGTIRFNVVTPAANRTGRATIYIKAGKFTRTLNIMVIDKFYFEKPWITSGIYNNATGVPVGFTFTIPEDYPSELLPLECKISVNEITGNVSMGFGEYEDNTQEPLRVITPDSYEGDWGEDTGFSYKYLYEATTVGQHRIYFTTRKTESDGNVEEDARFFFEAPNFVTVEKTITSSVLNSTIEFDDVFAYSENADVKYMLVPQIANSEVDIKFHLTLNGNKLLLEGDQTVPVRIYTDNLYSDALPFLEDDQKNGNGDYYIFTAGAGNHTDGVYTVPFTTIKADCAEAIRLADDRAADNEKYAFRSRMMELATYDDFNFTDVEIYGYEHDVSGRPVAGTKTQEIAYVPGSDVFVNFTAKSFLSKPQPLPDGVGTETKEVAPKYPVRCLIATANLEPADGQEGLELATDASGEKIGYYYDVEDGAPVQLRFQTDKIVSAGDVTISSVGDNRFEPYVQTLTNQPIKGMMYYAENRNVTDPDGKKLVPAGSFVTLERQDGTRIGQVVVRDPVADPVYGEYNYTLTLRGEYRYGWDDTKVTFKYSPENTKDIYGATTYLSIIQTESGGVLGLDPDTWDQTGN